MTKLTINNIEESLIDGLDFTKEQRKQIHCYLCNALESGLTLKELNEKCWEDSDAIFQEIFGS